MLCYSIPVAGTRAGDFSYGRVCHDRPTTRRWHQLFEELMTGKTKPPRILGDPTADTTTLHVAYALCAASLLTGLSAIAGLILAYVKRGDVARSWQGRHRTIAG